MSDLPRTLFVGRAQTPSCWYRAALPAEQLGADWIGVAPTGAPTQVSGAIGLERPYEDWFAYDVVVLQQPMGEAWRARIAALRRAGVTVLYETDDERRAVAAESARSTKELARDVEQTMKACDGVIFATDWLARQFRGVGRRAYVCRHGLDLHRYDVSRVERATVHIGWAGRRSSHVALIPWIGAVNHVLRERPDTCFVSIGASFAQWLAPELPAARRMAISPSTLECYPSAMSLFDIALAPTDGSRAFRAKSDLRFLEAAALGAAVVADPRLYDTVQDGVTGLHARTPLEVRAALLALVDDAELRRRLGAAAQAYVREERSIERMAAQWAAVLRDVAPVAA